MWVTLLDVEEELLLSNSNSEGIRNMTEITKKEQKLKQIKSSIWQKNYNYCSPDFQWWWYQTGLIWNGSFISIQFQCNFSLTNYFYEKSRHYRQWNSFKSQQRKNIHNSYLNAWLLSNLTLSTCNCCHFTRSRITFQQKIEKSIGTHWLLYVTDFRVSCNRFFF